MRNSTQRMTCIFECGIRMLPSDLLALMRWAAGSLSLLRGRLAHILPVSVCETSGPILLFQLPGERLGYTLSDNEIPCRCWLNAQRKADPASITPVLHRFRSDREGLRPPDTPSRAGLRELTNCPHQYMFPAYTCALGSLPAVRSLLCGPC